MTVQKLTFDDKTNLYPFVDRERQICAEDINELKTKFNDNIDENFNRSNTPQLGYKLLADDFDFANIPADYDNSIWEIRKVYDLAAGAVVLPENVTLRAIGGKLTNYTSITGDNTKIEAGFEQIFDKSGDLLGTWQIEKVFPQWFGALKDIDSTEHIQYALDFASGKGKVVLNENYIVNVESATSDALNIPSNTHLILEQNVVLTLAATTKSSYSVIAVYDSKENIIIEGGKIDAGRSTHVGATGESGHGILVGDLCDNIVIKNIEVYDAWGDGIVLAAFTLTDDASTNILIDNVYCHNNRRQGLSIISAKNVIVRNSRFEDTNGTAPQSGIDIEPNVNNVVDNVLIDGCIMANNTGMGLVMASGATATTNNIKVTNCKITGNTSHGVLIGGTGHTSIQNIHLENIDITQDNTSTGFALWSASGKNFLYKNINILDDSNRTSAIAQQFGDMVTYDNIKIRSNGTKQGINATYNALNLNIVNCDFNTGLECIDFYDMPDTTRTNVLIQNNVFESNGLEQCRSIWLNDVYNCNIIGNKIKGSGFSAIEISNADNVVIKDNYSIDCCGFRNQIDAHIYLDYATNCEISGNYARIGSEYTNKPRCAIKLGAFGFASTHHNIIKDNNFLDSWLMWIDNYSTLYNIIQDWNVPSTNGSELTQLLSGATPAWNVNIGLNARITLSAPTTITMSNLLSGQKGILKATNGGDVAFKITFTGYTFKILNSIRDSANTVTVSGGTTIDVFEWYYDGTNVYITGGLNFN